MLAETKESKGSCNKRGASSLAAKVSNPEVKPEASSYYTAVATQMGYTEFEEIKSSNSINFRYNYDLDNLGHDRPEFNLQLKDGYCNQYTSHHGKVKLKTCVIKDNQQTNTYTLKTERK